MAEVPQPGTPQLDWSRMNQQSINQAAQGGAYSGGGNSGKLMPNSPVYLGQETRYKTAAQSANDRGMGSTPQSSARQMPYSEARLMPLSWGQAEIQKFVNTGILRKLPGFDTSMGMPEIVDQWDRLIQAADVFGKQAGGKNWTPWDVMNTYSNEKGNFGVQRRGDWEYDVSTGEKVRYVGPRSKTRTDRQVNLSSAADVKALTTQMLTELLGRAPSSKEVAQYRSSINAMEEAAPQITKTTDTISDMGEVTGSSSVTSGGVSTEAMAGAVTEGAKEGPEFGKYQAATTYWNAMMQMISGG
jgi:hypothetical protein